MIRRYFLTGIITILFTVSIFSQYEQTGGFARIRGMGNNPYIVDPYFTTVNPAWAGHYQNFLFGDLGSSAGNFQSGGVGQFIAANFHVGGGLSLGAMLTRNDFNGFSISRLDPGGVVTALNTIVPGAILTSLNNNLEIFGSFKSGGTSFGLGIAYASTSNESTPAGGTTSTGSASQIGFNAGIVTKLGGNFLLDLGASLIMPSASFEPGVGNTSEASQTIISVNGRFFFQYSSKLAFVPSVAFVTTSGTVDNGTTSTDLPSNTLIIVGIGVNYQVGDFLLAGGPAFSTFSTTTSSTTASAEETDNTTSFPVWNLGVEWDMNDWFVARFGYVAANQSFTNETAANANDVNETIQTQYIPLGATVGVGFRLGNFSLDATVNEDVLRQGFNNIGGGGATFAYLSLAYAMP